MSNITIRLYAIVAIILTAYGVSRLVQAQTKPPEVEMPTWTFRTLPLQLGNWTGEPTKLDPEIATATEADIIVDRLYQDDTGCMISLHSAMFTDPNAGVYHSPLNCYRANGWRKLDETRENLEISKDMTIPVALTTWEKEGQKVLVLFWYQLGEHVLYGRDDLGFIRWGSMRGQAKWPVLTKVMMQIALRDPVESQTKLLGLAQEIAKWLNQDEHRKYLGQWPGV
jgi:EpsI family protein